MSRKIVISVSNDLTTDQRVERVCQSLVDLKNEEIKLEILLVGRLLNKSAKLDRQYRTFRFKLPFNKGPLFYLALNYRLYFLLRKERPDMLLVNDLDTLLGNYLYHKWTKKKPILIYDSHEYFTEVPELQGRFSRKIWLYLERRMFPKIKYAYTVSNNIAKAYQEKYKVNVGVIRNLPILKSPKAVVDQLVGDKILIYQGAVNVNRGIELMVLVMKKLPDYRLYIFGDGDVFSKIKNMISTEGLEDRVILMGRKNPDELRGYTVQANLGLSLEEDIGLSYRYALPNKLFDYIHAEIPVLVSNLPEMKSIVKFHGVGEILNSREAKDLAIQIRKICENESLHTEYKNATKVAKLELKWEKEGGKVKELFKEIYKNELGKID